jgi:hypothetical protein
MRNGLPDLDINSALQFTSRQARRQRTKQNELTQVDVRTSLNVKRSLSPSYNWTPDDFPDRGAVLRSLNHEVGYISPRDPGVKLVPKKRRAQSNGNERLDQRFTGTRPKLTACDENCVTTRQPK